MNTSSYVLQGTCGWQDQQYPNSIKKDAASRLSFYSQQWPCVEVNSSCYMIPTATGAWSSQTPLNFTFTFKAFGLFCSKSIAIGNLPLQVRELLNHHHNNNNSIVSLHEMSDIAINTTWNLFNQSLEPVYKSHRLGPVMFQFHLSFTPSTSNLNYILECRQRLDPRYNMAVEFRCRRWFTDPQWKERTHKVLSMQGIAWVAADELEHETFQKDREQKGLSPGAVRRVLPIALEVTTPEFFYIRVHRRHGFEDRRLDEGEIKQWAERIAEIQSRVKGPIYVFWGTEHKNVPQMNRNALYELLPRDMRYDWKVEMKRKRGSLMDMLSRPAEKIITVDGGGGDVVEEKEKQIEKRGIKRYFSAV